jgi:hypothetical protein
MQNFRGKIAAEAALATERQRVREVVAVARRIVVGKYLAWTNAGGPYECKHGVAGGIPCNTCDRDYILALAREKEGKLNDKKPTP